VTLKLKNAELDEIIQALADQSGNRPLPMPTAWEMKPLTIEVTDMPYWQALDKVCAEAGLMYIPDYQAGGLRLTPNEDGIDVSAYAGPFVVKLDSATKRKYFRPQNRRFQTDGLSYSLIWFWEDRLTPIESTVTMANAAAPGGEALELAPMVGRGVVMGGFMMGGGRRGGRGRTMAVGNMNVNITEVPKDLEKVGEISGVAKLTMGEDELTLKINDVLAGGEKSGTVGNTTVTVVNVNRRNTWAWLQLRQTVDGKPAPAVGYPAGSPYGFFLVDPNGERHQGRSWAGGAVRRMDFGGGRRGGRNRGQRDGGQNDPAQGDQGQRNQAPPPPDGPPPGGPAPGEAAPDVRAQRQPGQGGDDQDRRDQRRRDRRAQIVIQRGGDGNAMVIEGAANPMAEGIINVNFNRLPEIEGAWALLCVLPAKTTEKEFPFTFKDMPLP